MEEKTTAAAGPSGMKILVCILLSLALMVLAQTLALIIAELPLSLGAPLALCNAIAGLLYMAFTAAGTLLLCRSFLKIPAARLRISKISIKPFWLLAALLMPGLVIAAYMLTGGHWQAAQLSGEAAAAAAAGAVFFYGMAAGVVEELVFRGLIMGCLEQRLNIKAAVIIPSVLFGLIHILGNSMSFLSMLQLLIAGSAVGILFSLIAVESGSVWNSALVHGVWNMALVGGLLHIGRSPQSGAVFNYIIDSDSFLISGGDFGIEASVISIGVYLVFIAAALIRLKNKSAGQTWAAGEKQHK